jgi:outer membrane receptor for ferric coprogen and ferric-rhodotorulic acid
MPTLLRACAVAGLLMAISGCSTNSTYNSGHVSRVNDPIISTPRVNGSTTSSGTRASTSVTVGNRSTPGRVYINARATPQGVSVAPSFRSRYLNWRF